MKIFVSFLSCALLLFLSGANVFAQSGEITIILLRHAEKDTSSGADKRDPDLTVEGRARAGRLIETVRKYKPDLIYSTVYRRTRATVLPLAETVDARYRIPIRTYNFDRLEEFAGELLRSNARTIVVVGHNTTTPELANLLTRQEKYKALDENEYDKIWIVKIRRNARKPHRAKEKVIKY